VGRGAGGLVGAATRTAVVVGLLVALTVSLTSERSSALAANGRDLINRKHAGPIKIGKTTFKRAKKIFGKPTKNKIVQRGCIKVRRARWGRALTIYFGKDASGTATEVRIQKREIGSKTKGLLRIHTKKGLRVGDATKRVRKLYPRAQRYRVKGKWLWELKRNTLKGRLQAWTNNGKVVRLSNGPYEYC
jgi:hypothetical protein